MLSGNEARMAPPSGREPVVAPHDLSLPPITLGPDGQPEKPSIGAADGQQPQQLEKQSSGESCHVEDCEKCGCGKCKPLCIQSLARPCVFLVCISALVLTQALLVAGYTNSVLTTIEKRYNLWSSELGVVVSSYDITCMIAVIMVSYTGERHNRPMWLGRGAIIMGVGALLFTLPHFIGSKYTGGKVYNETEADINLCNSSANVDNIAVKDADCDSRNPETWALILFVIAQLVIGFGTSPIYTLGPTYLYDNVASQLYSIYAGIMYSMSALGPALGFLMGALFLSIYVEPADTPEGLTDKNTTWVGAWWMGFVVCAILAIAVSIPLMMFPKELPKLKKPGMESCAPTTIGFGKDIRDFPRQVKSLLTNSTWLSISLALVAEQSISTGFVTFIAKYFQTSFDFSASKANIITGSVIIPGAFLGIITGGLMMKRLHLDIAGTAKLLIYMNIIPSMAIIVLLFLGCQNVDLAGINMPYTNRHIYQEQISDMIEVSYKENLTSECNVQCACSMSTYEPVCGGDQKTYFSPCHAGCTALRITTTPDGLTTRNYSHCSCVYETFIHSTSTAVSGKCDTDCYNFVPFLIILFLIVFLTCCGQNPVLLITLRSVDSGSRSFALGMQNVLLRILAFVPAPIYFGRVFDNECILWTPSCEGDGACLEYNIQHLPFTMFGTCLGIKGFTFFFLFLTYISDSWGTRRKEYELTPAPTMTTIAASTPADTPASCSAVGVIYKDYTPDQFSPSHTTHI